MARASRRRRLAVLLVILTALTGAEVTGCGAGPAGQQATLAPAPLLSGPELAGSLSIARDCGYSAQLPADPRQSLWLFCDTPVYTRRTGGSRPAWRLEDFLPGTTAAVGSAVPGTAGTRAEGTLAEAGTPRVTAGEAGPPGGPTPPGRLAPFFGPPGGLYTSAGLPCGYGGGSYAASWVSGVTRVPSSPDLLITFGNYCVISKSGVFTPEGFGLAEYDPADRTLSDDVTVFYGQPGSPGTEPAPLGSPVFDGGYLYLFGPTCASPLAGGCAGTMVEARVAASPQDWGNPLRYQWRADGPAGPWTSDPAAATALVPGPSPAGAQDVADFTAAGHGLVLIEQTDIRGGFTVYQSTGPAGPWSPVRSGRVACRGLRPGYANFCRAIIGHPELSTRSELVVSYFDPTRGPGGHVMVEGFRW